MQYPDVDRSTAPLRLSLGRQTPGWTRGSGLEFLSLLAATDVWIVDLRWHVHVYGAHFHSTLPRLTGSCGLRLGLDSDDTNPVERSLHLYVRVRVRRTRHRGTEALESASRESRARNHAMSEAFEFRAAPRRRRRK